jgi:hypothetical protein
MELMYHNDWRGNFGDDLNIPFFDFALPEYSSVLSNKKLYGIGTLLNDVHGDISNSLVFGSGFGYGKNVKLDLNTSKVFGVRGPLTANKLGLDPKLYVIGDPAMFVEEIPSLMSGMALPGREVIALHHGTAQLLSFSDHGDYIFLDPGTASISDYIATIKNASFVYAESLHAAILAATFGIPFYPISITTKLDQNKWLDFYSLIEEDMPSIYSVSNIITPLIRRVIISGKVRRFFEVSRDGVNVDEVEIDEMINGFVKTSLNKKGVIVDANVIARIKSRLGAAISELREYAR